MAQKTKQPETVITLVEPIEHGSETITELRIRRPKAKDFRAMPATNPDMGDILDLLGRLAAQPNSVIDELGPDDLMKAAEVVGNFIPGGPKIGKKRSR